MIKYKTRYDPPDMFQALDAAEGLTDDPAEQADIAASLLGSSVEEARAALDERAEARNKAAERQTAPMPQASWADRPARPVREDAYDSMPQDQFHPLDNRQSDYRPSAGRRGRTSSTPEVVVVRKSRPRVAAPTGENRPATTRKTTLEGKLRLNLS